MSLSGLLYTFKLLFLAEVGGEHQVFLRKQVSWKKVGATLDADPVSVTVPGSSVRHTRGSKDLGAYSDSCGRWLPKEARAVLVAATIQSLRRSGDLASTALRSQDIEVANVLRRTYALVTPNAMVRAVRKWGDEHQQWAPATPRRSTAPCSRTRWRMPPP